jgi:transposase
MKLHRNARTCPNSRALIARRVLEDGWSLTQAAEAAGVSERTVRRWRERYLAEGEAGLVDRSSRPHRQPRRTAPEQVTAAIGLRRTGMTAAEIAGCLGMAERTVSRILARAGLGRLSRLDQPAPANRFETPRPGELVHIDVKKLAVIVRPGHRIHGDRRTRVQGAGWELVHVALDGASRLAYSEVLADERKETRCAFLRRAVTWFAAQGIRVERS